MFLQPANEYEKLQLLRFQIFLTVGAIGAWIFLGPESLLNSDDVLYAQMARESLDQGSFIEHSWMGATLFEKPPLLVWLLQLSGWLFGFSDGVMRLPAAIGAACTLVYTFKLTELVLSKSNERWIWSWLAAATLCASWTFVEAGSRVMTDTLLSAAVMAMCYYAIRVESSDRAAWSVRLGIAAGLGFMAKSFAIGPTSLAVFGFLLWRKKTKGLAIAIGLATLIVLPWHILMTLRHGSEFWEVYVGYHVVGRTEGIAVGQQGPAFYVSKWFTSDPMVVIALLTGLLTSFVIGFKRGFGKTILPMVAATLGLVVIHVSQTKFIHYSVPIIPLLTVITVSAVSRIPNPRVGIQLMLVVIVASSGFFMEREEHDSSRPGLKKLAEKHILNASDDTRLIVFNDYAPALYFYGQQPGELWTDSKRFYEIQQSIDMMERSGIVHFASVQKEAALRMEKRPMLLMAPHVKMKSLRDEMRENPMSQALRRIMNHFVSENRKVELYLEQNYLVVHVEGQR